ncbi:L,D-transpeptidase family protein [Spelaeicoccus albus]|uniref:L,D-peptidoglycan transpeptidase YkuD (ErfK/YbiS/YcfS/YnhG family) n=1 Tax=Spelaeicoccus albus TaxID=1280376 RepID=A0A7Z0D3G8_9MICO|nr:L,D-transpeptidase family protein [Spelaeicoccus albus]NYI68187.1 L,D-peptidoglycan transpeptidase YkuD (ErfK/YbiS/YcfS/YnhG family) [Spelaeicoccus albus]
MRHAASVVRTCLTACAAVGMTAAALTGCGGTLTAATDRARDASPSRSSAEPGDPIPGPGQRSPGTRPTRHAIPGIGPHTMRQIPKRTTQVLVSATETKTGSRAHTTMYRLVADGTWKAVDDWPGHNGKNGWKKHRSVGDATTPIGVFGLTDAGGYLANPGTKLSYDRDPAYRSAAAATYGDSFKKVFNYLIAINFNRVAGSKPTDSRHPHGAARGGKIWLHVDHHSPTHGCITLPQSGMKFLLTHLDPKARPVIVTGPKPVISR